MKRWILLSAVLAFVAAGCSKGSQTKDAAGESRVSVAVTDSGFVPASVTVPAGTPVTLVFTRKTDQTCAKEIVFAEQGIRKELPLDQAVEINLPASEKHELNYTCGMSMISGKVVVQ